MSIKSPYNFVPLSENVFRPPWGASISHDVPYEDGLSGVLEVEIEAMNPVFFRDGSPKPADLEPELTKAHQNPRQPEYSQMFQNWVAGRDSPQATSVKGMLRNVLAIASRCAIGPTTDDRRFSIRDLTDPGYRNALRNVRAGWLTLKESNHGKEIGMIEECKGKFAYGKNFLRPTYKELRSFSSRFKKTLKLGEKYGVKWNAKGGFEKKKLVHGSNASLVFAGHVGSRKAEYFFPNDTLSPTGVSEDTVKIFRSVNSKKGKPTENWNYYLNNRQGWKRIPVFFLRNIDGTIASFGLSLMYRMPSKKGIYDALPEEHLQQEDGADMTRAMFGEVGKRESAGRVWPGNFLPMKGNRRVSETTWVTVGSPEASFTNAYFEQFPYNVNSGVVENGKVATWTSHAFQIRGWKRYPVRHDKSVDLSKIPLPGMEKSDVASAFRPWATGSKFKGKIRFHNLHPSEFSALIWAIQLGNAEGSLRHSLGGMKMHGCGSVRITIEKSHSKVYNVHRKPVDLDIPSHLIKFQEDIEKWLAGMLPAEIPGVREMRLMADPNIQTAEQLGYPEPFPTAYRDLKNSKKVLRTYGEQQEFPSAQ